MKTIRLLLGVMSASVTGLVVFGFMSLVPGLQVELEQLLFNYRFIICAIPLTVVLAVAKGTMFSDKPTKDALCVELRYCKSLITCIECRRRRILDDATFRQRLADILLNEPYVVLPAFQVEWDTIRSNLLQLNFDDTKLQEHRSRIEGQISFIAAGRWRLMKTAGMGFVGLFAFFILLAGISYLFPAGTDKGVSPNISWIIAIIMAVLSFFVAQIVLPREGA